MRENVGILCYSEDNATDLSTYRRGSHPTRPEPGTRGHTILSHCAGEPGSCFARVNRVGHGIKERRCCSEGSMANELREYEEEFRHHPSDSL